MRAWIAGLPEPARRMGHSAGWLFGAQVVQMVTALVTMTVLARALGPAAFGTYGLVTTTLALAFGFLDLGSERQLVRDAVTRPDEGAELVWTGLRVRLIGAAILVPLLLAILWTTLGDSLPGGGYFGVALALILGAADAFNLPYLAQNRGREIARPRMIAALIVLTARLAIVAAGASLTALLFALALEQGLIALFLTLRLRRDGTLRPPPPFDRARVAGNLAEGFPVLLSTVAVAVYMRADAFMIEAMRPPADLGLYLLAARLAEMTGQFPGIIARQLLPDLARQAKISADHYRHAAQLCFAATIAMTLVFAATMALIAGFAVPLLFGNEYAGAVPATMILLLAVVFMNTGALLRQITTIERTQSCLAVATVVGALVNIALNLVLIPRLGIVGAAWASVVAYAIPGFLFTLAFARTRHLAPLMLSAPFAALREGKRVWNRPHV